MNLYPFLMLINRFQKALHFQYFLNCCRLVNKALSKPRVRSFFNKRLTRQFKVIVEVINRNSHYNAKAEQGRGLFSGEGNSVHVRVIVQGDSLNY